VVGLVSVYQTRARRHVIHGFHYATRFLILVEVVEGDINLESRGKEKEVAFFLLSESVGTTSDRN
jgi:hypothetical protein